MENQRDHEAAMWGHYNTKFSTEAELLKKIAILTNGLNNIIQCWAPPEHTIETEYNEGITEGMDWAIDIAAATLQRANKINKGD